MVTLRDRAPRCAAEGRSGRPRLARVALALALGVLGAMQGPVHAEDASASARFSGITLVFYWGVQCPHCQTAKPFVDGLTASYPGLRVERVEVQRDTGGRQRFLEHMAALGVSGAGVPTFVVGDRNLVGFEPGRTEDAVRHLIDAAAGVVPAEDASSPVPIELPLFGSLDWRAVSFPVFTVLVGLADGFNPCAFWVLTVLLSLLLRVRSRRRLAAVGALFVVMSGLVYFLFMTAWAAMFALAGMSRWLTQLLGAALLAMGLINLKELVWFKKGPSLMIPEGAKAGLYGRMRAITGAASVPAAVVGIAALAFVVNLVELGCTVGLPAVYTRVLTLQPGLGPAGRYAYLALYNLAYVVPLGLGVVVYAITLHRFTLTERGAKVLKTISGVLLTSFGILFLLKPGVLG